MKTQNVSERVIAYLALISGISISAVAIYYSVAGLVSIFAASVIPIIVMGVTLELSKLIATLWLKINWFRAPRLIKTYLLVAIAILMVITSMGIFGYLSKAHLDQSLISGDVAARLTVINEKIALEEEKIEDARKTLSQLDVTVEQTLGRSKTEMGVFRAEQLKRSQNKDRTRIRESIDESQTVIAKLKEERAPILSEMRKVEAEVGPIKYIASVIYGEQPDTNLLEKAVTWVIIVIVVVFDPLAVVLLLASQYSFQWFRADKVRAVEDAKREIELEEEKQAQLERDRVAAETEALKHQLELQQLANQIAEEKAKETAILATQTEIADQVVDRFIAAHSAVTELETTQDESKVEPSNTEDSQNNLLFSSETIKVADELDTATKDDSEIATIVATQQSDVTQPENVLAEEPAAVDKVTSEELKPANDTVVFEMASKVDSSLTPVLDLTKTGEVNKMLDVQMDDTILETLISDIDPQFESFVDDDLIDDQDHVSAIPKFQDLDRPGDYLTSDPFVEIAEDNSAHPDEKTTLKSAKSRWKKENPQKSLKYQRELLQKGLITRLPWEVPEYVAAVEALEAAEEAAKWATEQLEQTPDDVTVIEAAKWANEQLEIHYQQLEDTAQLVESENSIRKD